MIRITKEKWDSISKDYKNVWRDYLNEKPEWVGKKVVMGGCISNNPAEASALLVEGVHFIIEK